MIDILIRKFIHNYNDLDNKNVREAYGVLAGLIGIICNFLLFGLKLSIGLMINSLAIISDAFNNLTDMGSSLIAIIGAKLSNRPPDREHPFGHGRFEYISALTVAFIILAVGLELIQTSIDKMLHPEPTNFNETAVFILIFSILIKLWMYAYNKYIGIKINSEVNKATASDSLNDVIATGAVLLTALIGKFSSFPLDGIVSLFIAVIILYTGYGIAKDTINLLLGSAPSPALIKEISEIVRSGKYITGTHDLKIHDYGPGRVFASIHAEVPEDVNLVEVHAILDNLEDIISDKMNINIVLHMDPISTNPEKIEATKELLDSVIHQEYPGFKVARLRITDGKDRLNIIFDLIVPATVSAQEHKIIRQHLAQQLRQINSRCHTVIASITTR